MTAQCFADAAKLAGIELFVPASDGVMKDVLSEFAAARRRDELKRQSEAFLRKAGLVPEQAPK
jgi:hypothetical protein